MPVTAVSAPPPRRRSPPGRRAAGAVVAMALAGLGSLLLTQVSVGGSYSAISPRPAAARPGHRRRLRRRLDRVADRRGRVRGRARLGPEQRLVPDRRRRRRGDPLCVAVSGAHGGPWPRSPTATGPPSPWRSPSRCSGLSPRACCSARAASAAPPSRPSRPPPDQPHDEQENPMNMPPIVSPQDWHAAWEELLLEEKELTPRATRWPPQRRRMPRLAVRRATASTARRRLTLPDLFEGRRQLIVYRHFFEPGVAGWPEKGCRGCTMMADQDAHPAHLNARDTTLAYVSRAPQPDIVRWKARRGGGPVVHADRRLRRRLRRRRVARHQRVLPRRRGIFRTYFVDGRGDEALGSTFSYLDITALGRQEDWEDSPAGYPQTRTHPEWWRLPDEYEDEFRPGGGQTAHAGSDHRRRALPGHLRGPRAPGGAADHGRRRFRTGGRSRSARASQRPAATSSATTTATPAAPRRIRPGEPGYTGDDLVADALACSTTSASSGRTSSACRWAPASRSASRSTIPIACGA